MAYNLLKGSIINPTLPAFLVYLNTTVANVTGDATNYTCIYDTEVFDQANNFDISTGIFTAPVTGKYCFEFGGQLGGGTSIAGGTANFFINTTPFIYSYSSVLPSGATRLTAYGAVTVALTAGNTAFISVQTTDTGGKIDDFLGLSESVRNYFSGSLIC